MKIMNEDNTLVKNQFIGIKKIQVYDQVWNQVCDRIWSRLYDIVNANVRYLVQVQIYENIKS